MRYIDIIRTLIRNASEKDIPALDWDEQQKHLSMIKARIDDVEIVVRCKDCKWWSGSANTSHNNHPCKRALDQNIEYWTKDDDYCSYGELKGGDTE